jgi:diguanylate cyclase (GGDEF)-like protein
MNKDALIAELRQQLAVAETVIGDLRKERDEDMVTGLLNRRGFEDAVEMAQERAGRTPGRRVGLVYIDLDGFKPINDTHGHATGDSALKQVAERIRTRMRKTDAAARLGGDEFGIVLEGIRNDQEAISFAIDVLRLIKDIKDVDGKSVSMSASVGVATTDPTDNPPSVLIGQADAAMYRAKAEGKSAVAYHDKMWPITTWTQGTGTLEWPVVQ